MVAPPRAPKVTRRRNPSYEPLPEEDDPLASAIAQYEAFHWGEPANKVTRRRVSKAPRHGVKLGVLRSVTYETSKGGELALWQHEFGEEGGEPPDLVMDPDNKKLHIVGGTYDVRTAGIID